MASMYPPFTAPAVPFQRLVNSAANSPEDPAVLVEREIPH